MNKTAIGLPLAALAQCLLSLGVSVGVAAPPGQGPIRDRAEAGSGRRYTEAQAEEITVRNLTVIAWAVMNYAGSHAEDGVPVFPPALVPNDSLPEGKHLSGFVHLLPYLGSRPAFVPESHPVWQRWHKMLERSQASAKNLHASIDLTKAWDAPENALAGKKTVPFFITPSGASLHDEKGYALSHFALVRGSSRSDAKRDDGPFPLVGRTKVRLADIADGTSYTLCVGQVHDSLGPWIASGVSTSRLLQSLHDKAPSTPTFGSPHAGCAYFATCDTSTHLLDMARTDEQVLLNWATRSGRDAANPDDTYRFTGVSAWRKSLE